MEELKAIIQKAKELEQLLSATPDVLGVIYSRVDGKMSIHISGQTAKGIEFTSRTPCGEDDNHAVLRTVVDGVELIAFEMEGQE